MLTGNNMQKKRIVFINNHFQYSDGTVRALIGLVNNLDQTKFDITIKPLYRCNRRLACELKPGIKLEKCFGFYFRGFSKIAKMLPVNWLYRRFIGAKYDIEVAFQCDLPTILVGASENKNAVHVYWMHGWGLFPEQYAKADLVVCVSRANEERVRSEMNGEVNVTHCYNLLDDGSIVKLSRERIPVHLDFDRYQKPVFVTVGRLSPEKGYTRLVRIFKRLSDAGYGFTLIIVGGGDEEQSIVDAIKDCGLESRIVMTGALNNPHCVTSRCDCFVCSSFSEGYSTACTEAAILGVPVITTDVPGGREIIDECGCGLLTGKDDGSLEGGIRQVLQKPELLSEWKEKLRETKARFGLHNRVSEMRALFDGMFDKKHVN